jgi:predicted transcriptional regulator of viral defense system
MTEPIDIYIPASAEDPRSEELLDLPGVTIHRGPALHPEDTAVVNGLPVTSVARTLVDCAECCSATELRALFLSAKERGLLDVEAVRRSRARVEWRPSLAMFDAVFTEFDE